MIFHDLGGAQNAPEIDLEIDAKNCSMLDLLGSYIGSLLASRCLQHGFQSSQDGSKTTQGASKTRLICLQDRPSTSQNASRTAPSAPKTPPRLSKSLQDGSGSLQDASKSSPEELFGAPKPPPRALRGAFQASSCCPAASSLMACSRPRRDARSGNNYTIPYWMLSYPILY